ncbi:UTP--glucose-1-phosphate uridylyltransferase [Thermococcus sibiricus]|uniref:UTP--glucose-1-phosphate uridylyltransferase n=1 Tax=Thermococcus sibiricus TaxID=172049 RepID=A0A124FF39_9EURY|nr:UTP--glucose-1-phosphate uridylyltransferase [Thermococcus sibiricus]KUK16866.1 MAG: UTP-glucose-1-phosphate uridylyltransferase [Thermococcus sibiricus]
MKIRKAVIPAAGYGTRMLPLTKAQPKEMLPVVHKPVIQYVVEEAYYSGIREILIITGRHKRAIEDHFDRSDLPKKDKYTEELDRILDEVDIFFVRQREQKGLGDAVRYAEAFVDDEPFALLLGDNITIPNCTKELVECFVKLRSPVLSVEELPLEKLSLHGVIKGRMFKKGIYLVEDIVEKPKPREAPSNLCVLGRYILTPKIFDHLKAIDPGYGGEYQLTDAIRRMLSSSEVYAHLYTGKRYDIGNKLDWLKANVELALKDEEIGDDFRSWLEQFSMKTLKFKGDDGLQ